MLVVYGNLGVHEIETVGPQSFCGEPAKEYYTLRPLVERVLREELAVVFQEPPEDAGKRLLAAVK